MSNLNKKFEKRSARPGTIGGAMGELLQIFGMRASDADLAARWDKIMGPDIAGVAKLAAIKKMRDGRFNITLRPVNPAFTLQLSYMENEIKNKINKYFGRDAVAKISFRR